MTIGFVFTNFNNTRYTSDLLGSLNGEENEFRIVVVDNASDVKSVKLLRSLESIHANLDVIYLNKNIGYFPGINAGLTHLKSNYSNLDFVVIGNNDLIFPVDFSDMLNKNIKLFEKYPVVCPNIITLSGEHQNPHLINKVRKIRQLIYYAYYLNFYLSRAIYFLSKITNPITKRKDHLLNKASQEIYSGYGACYILGPVFFTNYDLLSSPVFLLHEEYFLSKQLQDKGFSMFYEASISVCHVGHVATKKLPSKHLWELGRESYRKWQSYEKGSF